MSKTHKYETCYHYDYDSNDFGKFKIIKILGCRGKTKVPYYRIRFKDTGNEENVPEHNIDKGTAKDKKKKKKKTKKKRKNKRQEYFQRKDKGNFKTNISVSKDDYILSIDGSTTSTGYVVWKNKKPINYTYRFVDREEYPAYLERSLIMVKYLEILINRYDIKAIFVEDTILLNKPILKKLSELKGMTLMMARLMGLEICVISVNSWKGYISKTGWKKGFGGSNREQSKKATIKRVKEIYGIDVKKGNFTDKEKKKQVWEDLADAFGIGHYANNQKIDWR